MDTYLTLRDGIVGTYSTVSKMMWATGTAVTRCRRLLPMPLTPSAEVMQDLDLIVNLTGLPIHWASRLAALQAVVMETFTGDAGEQLITQLASAHPRRYCPHLLTLPRLKRTSLSRRA